MELLAQATTPSPYLLGLSEIFVLFFIMLGPLKILVPFAQLTKTADEPTLRKLALKAFTIALIAALAGGFIGSFLLGMWHVSTNALMLAAGIIFFLVALIAVLQQYDAPQPPPQSGAGAPNIFRFVFPTIVPPYGIAAVIALLAISADAARTWTVVGVLAVIMVLNLIAMVFVRPILKAGMIPLQVLGAVLGVMQVALATQIILGALRGLGIISAASLGAPWAV